jgi:hypothetical protein
LKVEYYENGGGANVALWWEKLGVTCNGQYKAEYYNNRYLNGSPVYVTCEGWPVSHDWGNGGPGNGVPNDGFSARWTGRAHINAGTYNFIARADDGIRVYLNGGLVIDAWKDQGPTDYRKKLTLANGDYDIKVEYYENGGGAVAQFRWEPAGVSVEQPSGNLARGKSASSTSNESSSFPASNGNDGNNSSRWSSRISTSLGTEWWWVDLGSQQTFNRVVINWEASYASSYFMCWSNDTNICYGYSYHAVSGGPVTLNVGNQTARYLWLKMDSRAPRMNNYSFFEFEAYYYPNNASLQTALTLEAPQGIDLPNLQ